MEHTCISAEMKWRYDDSSDKEANIYVEVDADWAGEELGRTCDGGFEFVCGKLLDGLSTVQQKCGTVFK